MGIMTKERWVALAVVVITVLTTLMLIALLEEAEGKTEVVVAPSKYDARIGELEREAIEAAFKQHIGQLYKIWVTDNYEPKFPPKAIVGARNARDAFIRSMDAIEERGQLAPPRP
jgi:hypothetical protein